MYVCSVCVYTVRVCVYECVCECMFVCMKRVRVCFSVKQSSCYDTAKGAILRAYELVPEAYHQRFHNYRKTNTHMLSSLQRKSTCLINGVVHRRLALVEEFKNSISEAVATSSGAAPNPLIKNVVAHLM